MGDVPTTPAFLWPGNHLDLNVVSHEIISNQKEITSCGMGQRGGTICAGFQLAESSATIKFGISMIPDLWAEFYLIKN
jgi:hypothetical protein